MLRRLRLGVWLVAGLSVAYLFLRFDSLTLPEGCSPLLRYASGARLLLDRRFPILQEGDAVIFRGPEGTLLLGLVERAKGEGHPASYWLVTDAPDCPGIASPELGWIAREAVLARVLFAWPF